MENCIKNISYIYGLFVTDGNIYIQKGKNKGKCVLELSYKDKDIIEKLYNIIPNCFIRERVRNTNFSKQYHSISINNYTKEFRQKLFEYGFPKRNKTLNANIPIKEYSESDFWRGVIDGDGSIGITKNSEPFISLVTKSDCLFNAYLEMLKRNFNLYKVVNKNKRDNCYNIVVKNEDAIALGEFLYNKASVYINRKYEKFLEFKNWKRNKKKVYSKTWTPEQDNFILNNSIECSMQELQRTLSSIKNRLFRLKHK